MKKYQFDENSFKNHPWYKCLQSNGIKKQLLIKALLNLQKMKNNKFIIYNAPVASDFKKMSLDNGIWKFEQEYCFQINKIIKQYNIKNITFYNLTNMCGFKKNDFYDPQHLCESGAVKFSKKIISIFRLNN